MEMTGVDASDKAAGVYEARASGLEIAVLDPDHHPVPILQRPPDAVGDADRTVAAAGATDRDRQVALALGNVGRDEGLEQRPQATVELPRRRARIEIGTNPLGEPGPRPQVVDVVWIGQETHVEGQVGVAR